MVIFDYIILALLAGFLLKGIFKGLIRQVLALGGMIAGVLLAWQFAPVVSALGIELGIPSTASMIIAFVLIYAAAAYTAKLLTSVLEKIFKVLLLNWLNRLAGGVFGLLEGILLVVIILIILSFTPLERSIQSSLPRAPVLKMMKELTEPFTRKTVSETKVNGRSV